MDKLEKARNELVERCLKEIKTAEENTVYYKGAIDGINSLTALLKEPENVESDQSDSEEEAAESSADVSDSED